MAPQILTSTPSAAVEAACLALAAGLAGELPLETFLSLAEALAVLSDVTPPYPPLPDGVAASGLRRAVDIALDRLTAAIEGTASAEERLRCARALGLVQSVMADLP